MRWLPSAHRPRFPLFKKTCTGVGNRPLHPRTLLPSGVGGFVGLPREAIAAGGVDHVGSPTDIRTYCLKALRSLRLTGTG